MTDPNLLAAVREALGEILVTQAEATIGDLHDEEIARAAFRKLVHDAEHPKVPERNIEDLAREWCAATGINPDATVTFGEMPPVPGTPDAKFMTGTVRPAWTQFIDQAYKFAQAVGIPVRKADKPGGYPLWISPESVTEYRAVPMARDDSSI
jgi:hypothetical protein